MPHRSINGFADDDIFCRPSPQGNSGGKKKSYLAVLIPCVVIFFIFLLSQRPSEQTGAPVRHHNFVKERGAGGPGRH